MPTNLRSALAAKAREIRCSQDFSEEMDIEEVSYVEAFQSGFNEAMRGFRKLIADSPELVEVEGELARLREACRRALHLVEENNEEIVQMSGSFGLLSDLRAALANAGE